VLLELGPGVPELVVITPQRGAFDLRELWRYRYFAWVLAARDVRLRYRQTALGVVWAVLQPALMALSVALVFGRLGGLNRHVEASVSYGSFVFAGLLPWQLFSSTLTAAGQSLLANQMLITKTYCPRLLVVIAALVPGIVDFCVSYAVLFVWLQLRGEHLSFARPDLVVLSVFMALALSLGFGLFVAVLSAEYRDARHALPFFVQVWFFVTPVAYPLSLFPEHWRTLAGLNPVAVVVEAFRAGIIGSPPPPLATSVVSLGVTVVVLVLAFGYFRRMERGLADVI